MNTCSLCSQSITNEAVIYKSFGKILEFCCQGCHSVYLILKENQLEGNLSSLTTLDQLSDNTNQDSDIPVNTVQFRISGMWCTSCSWLVQRVLRSQPGVVTAHVNFLTETADVVFNPEQTNVNRLFVQLMKFGYEPDIAPLQEEVSKTAQRTDTLIRFSVAFFLSNNIMMLSSILYVGMFKTGGWLTKTLPHPDTLDPIVQQWLLWIIWLLATPVVFYAGLPILRSAFQKLRFGVANMDTLITVGTLATYALSVYGIIAHSAEVYFDTCSMIVTFVLLGRYIEVFVKHRSKKAIQKLLELGANEARVEVDSKIQFKPVEEITIDSIVVVKPGEKIPLDGIVVQGESYVDESIISGESAPVFKCPNEGVIGATINQNGLLKIRVTRTNSETMLAQIIKWIENAQNSQAPLQRIVDKISQLFIPLVIVIAITTLIMIWITTGTFSLAILRASAVLVIACPCALGLATPIAILIAVNRSASNGILIRNGEKLEQAAKIDTIVFDKTGTLTEGKMYVTDVILPSNNSDNKQTDEKSLISIAACIEQSSEHHLANAIVNYAKTLNIELLSNVEKFEAEPGKGVKGIINNQMIYIGTPEYLTDAGISLDTQLVNHSNELSANGKTTVFVGWAGLVRGLIAIADTLKPTSIKAVSDLLHNGYNVIMLSGDKKLTAESIAKAVGITQIISEVKPHEKAKVISGLQKSGNIVAMVGDGINDAPALSQADLGIAMADGADIAIECADLVAIGNNIQLVNKALALSKATVTRIRQNLFWAFIYNVVGIPLAAIGLINPILAAAAMAVSSVSVVLNSMRSLTTSKN